MASGNEKRDMLFRTAQLMFDAQEPLEAKNILQNLSSDFHPGQILLGMIIYDMHFLVFWGVKLPLNLTTRALYFKLQIKVLFAFEHFRQGNFGFIPGFKVLK